jgi:hypothetical protein
MRRPDPRGLLLVGRDPWLLSLAGELVRQGVPAVVATRDRARPLEGDEPALYVGLLRDLPDAGVLVDVRGAVVATDDVETDLTAMSVLVPELGREHVWLLPAHSAGAVARPGRVDLEVWARRPFSPDADLPLLRELGAAGARARTVPAGEAPAGAVPLVRLHADGTWTATPGVGPGRPGDRLVVLDGSSPRPGAAPGATRVARPPREGERAPN